VTHLHSKPVATSEEVGTNERRDKENAMASQWLYSRDGTEHGPVSSSELMELAKNGQLLPTDFLWKEGMAEWKPASSFPKLFPAQATPDEMPVVVVTDSKPTSTRQSGGGTAKKSASSTNASSKKEESLDPFLVGLAIFFVAPLGLYLLWRHPVLKHRTKWWLCACGWLLFLVVSGGSSDEDMEGDARRYAKLNKEYMTVLNRDLTEMNMSMINKTRYKGTHKAEVTALKEELDAIDEKYSSGDSKAQFREMRIKAEADLR